MEKPPFKIVLISDIPLVLTNKMHDKSDKYLDSQSRNSIEQWSFQA